MQTHSKETPNSTRYRWATLIGLFALVFALIASAQEKACELSTNRYSTEITAHAQQNHSEHCIRHQDPLPDADGAKSSIASVALSIAILFTRASDIEFVFSRDKISIPNIVTFAGSGVPPYKRLAHFLI